MTETPEVYYRFEDYRVSDGYDAERDISYGSHVEVRLIEFEVVKRTRCGVWINARQGRRFINDNTNKRYACPTIDAARVSFFARKMKQKQIHQARAQSAQEALDALKQGRYNYHGLTIASATGMGLLDGAFH